MARSCLCVLRATTALVPANIATLMSTLHEHQVTRAYLLYHDDYTDDILSKIKRTSLFRRVIQTTYDENSKRCPSCDVNVLLHNINYSDYHLPLFAEPIELSIHQKIDNEISDMVETACSEMQLNITDSLNINYSTPDDQVPYENLKVVFPSPTLEKYHGVVFGGTFDRLHVGHKILISVSALFAQKKLVIGVTDDGYVRKSKILPELVQPVDDRVRAVWEFVQCIRPELELVIEPMPDGFGPSIVESDLELIVVSAETIKGGSAVANKRVELGLSSLEVLPINLVKDSDITETTVYEKKVSSSNKRKQLLGTRLKPINREVCLDKPYIIGLTGGIAAGKSSVSRKIIQNFETESSVALIDCDKLGHQAYEFGSQCFDKLVETFGDGLVLDKSGSKSINRIVLGTIVFSNPENLEKLNAIVWPEIRKLIDIKIEESIRSGAKLIVVDAAVLVEAGWDEVCNDIWTCIIPREEAIVRIQQRNLHLSLENAIDRIDSQLSNSARINAANVVFCTYWSHGFTMSQIEKALTTLPPEVTS